MIPARGAITWNSPSTRLLGLGRAVRLGPCGGRRRFETFASQLEELFSEADIQDEVDLPGSGPVSFGSFTFDESDPESAIVIPQVVYGVSDDIAWKTEMSLDPTETDLREAGEDKTAGDAGPTAVSEWHRIFSVAQKALGQGALEKVVLARKVALHLKNEPDEGSIVRHLCKAYPGCFTFAFEGFAGASPELLVRRLGDVVDSMPIAGSAPRGTNSDEDERLGAELIASAKNQAEHEITKRDVVGKLAEFCSHLEVEAEPSLLLLENVQHLSTKVQGKLRGKWNALQLAGALHPTAAVCGLPEPEAMELIRAVEDFGRGRYAGPIGWMDHRGDGEWAIALRCAELGNTSASLFAGAGILHDSEEAVEFEETEFKLQAMLSALIGGSV